MTVRVGGKRGRLGMCALFRIASVTRRGEVAVRCMKHLCQAPCSQRGGHRGELQQRVLRRWRHLHGKSLQQAGLRLQSGNAHAASAASPPNGSSKRQAVSCSPYTRHTVAIIAAHLARWSRSFDVCKAHSAANVTRHAPLHALH